MNCGVPCEGSGGDGEYLRGQNHVAPLAVIGQQALTLDDEFLGAGCQPGSPAEAVVRAGDLLMETDVGELGAVFEAMAL